jgi:ribosomal-protein-alanine N-acetyltransferase
MSISTTGASRVRRPRLIATGTRVAIRRPRASDADQFLAAVRASRDLHGSWASPPSTAEEFDAYLRRGRRAAHEQFLLVRRDDYAPVGVVNINEIVRGCFQSGYLGYYAFEPNAGRGYMTEGLGLVIAHAFNVLELHRLEANIQPGNKRSIVLVERLGFRREGFSPRYLKLAGQWRDHERWTVLAEEWAGSWL